MMLHVGKFSIEIFTPGKDCSPLTGLRIFQFSGVYSDLLFQPWLCASVGICDEWLERSNIDRRSNLSVEVLRLSSRALMQSN